MSQPTSKEQTRVIFASVPQGLPVPGTDIVVRKLTVDLSGNDLREGDFLLRNLYLSLDPYMRGRMREPSIKSYAPPFEIGKPMAGGAVSEVIKSKNEDFPEGIIVWGMIPFEEYTFVSADKIRAMGIRELPEARAKQDKFPLSYYLGVLGMPGATAYVGLKKYGKPKEGETLFVSAAAGAVGQVVGQMGKVLGLKVVGVAGSDAKVKYLKEIGFDVALNYKTTNLDEALSEHCPEGININFENVGGEILDTVLAHMAPFGRVPLCGYISEYNNEERYGVKNMHLVLLRRLSVNGFIVGEEMDAYKEQFFQDMGKWVSEGTITYKEDVIPGLENVPVTFLRLFKGENHGKLVIEISKL